MKTQNIVPLIGVIACFAAAAGCGVRDGSVAPAGAGPKVVAASTGYAFPTIGTRRKAPAGTGDVDSAETAASSRPEDSAARRKLGMAYYASGGYRAAATALEKVVAATPDDGEAWMYLGFARMGAGLPEAAVEALDRASKARIPAASRAAALAEAGTVEYQALRDDKKAMEYFRKALELAPKEGSAALALGTDAAQRKDRGGARGYFEIAAKALPAGPDRASVYACLGRLSEENGDKAGAQAWYRKAVADDPDNAWARTRVTREGR
ncbi:MAG: tetratricopeptide repeat protein [Armatimonadota bacterium]